MLSRIGSSKSLSHAFWIAIAFFGLPAITYAASIVIPSGEWIGLGTTHGRILFTEKGAVDDKCLPQAMRSRRDQLSFKERPNTSAQPTR
jgi:hypothetical protein